MNIALWIVAGLLTVAFVMTGSMKVAQPKAKLAVSGLAWVEDFSNSAVKGIGTLEVLGGLGLILPGVLDTTTILVPLAATGLILVMTGAVVVHLRRKETFVPPLVPGLLALFIAVFRFSAYTF